MTKQEQIEILERAIPLIDSSKFHGICLAIGKQMPHAYGAMGDWEIAAAEFLKVHQIQLPKINPVDCYCWPLTSEGDEARRQFLRDHIERLKKELTTP